MGAARPSQAAVSNVLAAMKAQGMDRCEVRVDRDGGFIVVPVDETPDALPSSGTPPRGKARSCDEVFGG